MSECLMADCMKEWMNGMSCQILHVYLMIVAQHKLYTIFRMGRDCVAITKKVLCRPMQEHVTYIRKIEYRITMRNMY